MVWIMLYLTPAAFITVWTSLYVDPQPGRNWAFAWFLVQVILLSLVWPLLIIDAVIRRLTAA